MTKRELVLAKREGAISALEARGFTHQWSVNEAVRLFPLPPRVVPREVTVKGGANRDLRLRKREDGGIEYKNTLVSWYEYADPFITAAIVDVATGEAIVEVEDDGKGEG